MPNAYIQISKFFGIEICVSSNVIRDTKMFIQSYLKKKDKLIFGK